MNPSSASGSPVPPVDAPLSAPAIRASGIWKSFGAIVANRGASLHVEAGEIHAVVGENGAGKSTLMRLLAGMYAPDAGRVEVRGREVTGWGTREAIAAGVGMVHQHFMLVPTLTVAENLVLGQEPRAGLQLDRRAAEDSVRALCARTGLLVDPRRRVSELTVGEAQRVEILKVLYRGATILILDEPTAVLSPPEVTELWSVLRRITGEGGGGTVVLITHKLDEVITISRSITVMRAGETVGRLETASATPASIARLMVGREVRLAGDVADRPAIGWTGAGVGGEGEAVDAATSGPGSAPRARPPVLSVEGVVVASSRKPNEVDGVTFDVGAGEILGIAGVEGNGQTELVEAIAGLRPLGAGRIVLEGRDLAALGVRARGEAGLSHIPEDRHRRGLVLEYSVGDNLILGLQHHFSAHGVLSRDRIAANSAVQIRDFDIRPAQAALPARALSGGNQQKVVVAREMRGREYSLLLASQPTRGVDVGAIEFIHAQIRAARDAGKGVLLVSADLVEVLALADRVAVMYEGRVVAMLRRGDATAEVVGAFMTGAHRTGTHAAVAGAETPLGGGGPG